MCLLPQCLGPLYGHLKCNILANIGIKAVQTWLVPKDLITPHRIVLGPSGQFQVDEERCLWLVYALQLLIRHSSAQEPLWAGDSESNSVVQEILWISS
jgi:hypothetical protein